MIRHPLAPRCALVAAALLLGLGCGNATTKPVAPTTVRLSFDLVVPADTPAGHVVMAELGGARPQPISLSPAADGRYHGSGLVTAGLELPFRFRLEPGDAGELDSLWAPVAVRTVRPGGDTTLAVAVAHWDYAPDPAAPDLTFLVTVPATTPAGDPVCVAGNQPQLGNWGTGSGLRLARRPDGRFMTRVRFPLNSALEFKFTRGSWETVEKDAGGNEIPNRTFSVTASDTLEALVATWRDQAGGGGGTGQLTGTIRYHRGVTSRYLTPTRDVIVYLPPQYDAQAPRRYPVLYLHDGQNTMDASTSFAGEWHADETAERLITAGQVEPLILVGVYNTADRIGEYTPVRDSQYGGGNGDNYGRFLVEELKPLIDSTYRTKTDAANTGVAGSSLGGLISMHFAETLSGTFGKAGVISPSVWWANEAIVGEVNATPKRPVRLWLDIGTAEGGGSSSETVAGARHLRDALLAKGWVLDQDLHYLEAPGAGHNEAAWAARFDRVLEFLYPATP